LAQDVSEHPTSSDLSDRLVAERSSALAQITALSADLLAMMAASESTNADDEHDPEGATIAFERAQLVAVLQQAQTRLADLDRGLALLADGTYGVCERCGEPIGAERLLARPAARTCILCARSSSRGGSRR
jgi:RNA polymerase-binding transcription factor DksA